jgi:hypothetical protein
MENEGTVKTEKGKHFFFLLSSVLIPIISVSWEAETVESWIQISLGKKVSET